MDGSTTPKLAGTDLDSTATEQPVVSLTLSQSLESLTEAYHAALWWLSETRLMAVSLRFLLLIAGHMWPEDNGTFHAERVSNSIIVTPDQLTIKSLGKEEQTLDKDLNQESLHPQQTQIQPRTGLDGQTFVWFDPDLERGWSRYDLLFWFACVDLVIVLAALIRGGN